MSEYHLASFSLSQSLGFHSNTARCVSVHEEFLLTGSYDKSLILSTFNGSIYEPTATYTHHSFPVYSCLIVPENRGLLSSDQNGMVYYTSFEGQTTQIASESKTVSSLDFKDGKILTGGWDGKAKIWDANTKQEINVLDSQKHTHAVCVKFTSFGILTGSQNGNLNFWDNSGNFIRSAKVHDDLIRRIVFDEEVGIVTCSNDSFVKKISKEGRVNHTYSGHSGYVFTCGLMGNHVISGGDDRTVKVWQDDRCIDSISHPNSVWDLGVNYKGDIITAGADSFVRLFTTDKDRIASEAENEEYRKLCTSVETESQDIDLSKFPNIDRINLMKGKKEGDIQVFNHNGVGEAFMWHVEGEYWEKIGEVTGKPTPKIGGRVYPGDQFFPAGEYDYIFDVDFENGDIRKLPYNNSQNPLEIAEKFIAKEGLGRGFVQQITKFINDNAKPSQNKPAPKNEQVKSRHFPVVEPRVFRTGNIDPIIKKIKEFNPLIQEFKMDEEELRCLDRVSEKLSSKSHNISLTLKEVKLVTDKLLNWPREYVFPCFDLYRYVVLTQSSQDTFKSSDHGAQHISHVLAYLNNCSENSILITAFRVLANMFFINTSSYAIELWAENTITSISQHLSNTNKNVRLGLVSILHNFSVKVSTKPDNSIKEQILSAFLGILEDEKDNENLYVSFVAIGTLLVTQNVQREILEMAKNLGFCEMISEIKCTEKALEVKNELLRLFR